MSTPTNEAAAQSQNLSAKHTPGPWSYREGFIEIGQPGSEEVIACLHATHGEPYRDQAANGPMMAAAPDLLAACKSFLAAMKKACELYGPDTPATAGMVTGAIAARAAIAKAEGQKP